MSESEPFFSKVELLREKIRAKFSRCHELLNIREAALLSELDELVVKWEGKDVRDRIQDLNQAIERVKSKASRNEIQEAVVRGIAPLEIRIEELKAGLETYKDKLKGVELEWDGELEERMSEFGGIRVVSSHYRKIGIPFKTACKHSPYKTTDVGVFRIPCSIAIHPRTNNVYICDFSNNRVQVFDSSLDFLFQFKDKMEGPWGICIFEDKLYITQSEGNCLNIYNIKGKHLNSVGKKGDSELEFYYPEGVAVSNIKNLIYVCDNANHRVQCLNLNLTFNSCIARVFGPRNIKLTQNEIVILNGGYHCIYIFNYSHQFVREMIRCGEGTPLIRPCYFTMDDQNNIIMTDWFSHCVAIFSISGDLIHKFGKKGNNAGKLIKPAGIVLTMDKRIMVVSQNANNSIQLF